MNARQFYLLVVKMRKAQREYFRTRAPHVLAESKQYEKEVDAEIERVTKIEQERVDNQQLKML